MAPPLLIWGQKQPLASKYFADNWISWDPLYSNLIILPYIFYPVLMKCHCRWPHLYYGMSEFQKACGFFLHFLLEKTWEEKRINISGTQGRKVAWPVDRVGGGGDWGLDNYRPVCPILSLSLTISDVVMDKSVSLRPYWWKGAVLNIPWTDLIRSLKNKTDFMMRMGGDAH